MQEKWEAAADAYRKALAANPLHVQARNNLGQILERGRDFDGAANEYRQAVEASPTFRLARFNLGRMLLVRGDAGQAIAEFEKLAAAASTPKRRDISLRYRQRSSARAEWLTDAGSAQRRRRSHSEFGQTDLAAGHRSGAGEAEMMRSNRPALLVGAALAPRSAGVLPAASGVAEPFSSRPRRQPAWPSRTTTAPPASSTCPS